MAAAGAGLLAACTADQDPSRFVAPDGDEVRAAEARRPAGLVREFSLNPTPGTVDLGGLTVATWSFDATIPGRPIRLKAGETLATTVHNGPSVDAGSDTAFRVALGGHRLHITHTDGFPVRPVDTDALLIGMGERYDAVVTLADGVFPLVGLAEGKSATAFAIVRTGSGAPPSDAVRPWELDRRILTYRELQPTDAVALPTRDPDRSLTLNLTGGMMAYDWGFNGPSHDPGHYEAIRAGERVRLGDTGLRKDTVIVLPGQTMPVVFDADKPGRWMLHCHNAYHAEAGMMTQVGYLP